MPYAIVKDLPDILQNALKSVGYGRKDILIEVREKESLFGAGGRGLRCFTILVDLSKEEYQSHHGSWGGSNCWNPNNSVDLDTNEYSLPLHGAVIKGSEGGDRPVYAVITLHPGNIAKFLPSSTGVTKEEAHILWCYKALKAGAYRQEALSKSNSADIDGLVEKGMLKRSKNGATQITTDGRNALEMSGYRGY